MNTLVGYFGYAAAFSSFRSSLFLPQRYLGLVMGPLVWVTRRLVCVGQARCFGVYLTGCRRLWIVGDTRWYAGETREIQGGVNITHSQGKYPSPESRTWAGSSPVGL